MSQYNAIMPTVRGQSMIIESMKTNNPLIFTKVEWGDGVNSSNNDFSTFTKLIHKVIESSITEKEQDGNTLYVTSVYDNRNLSTGFYNREIGVYAKVGNSGTEYLFAYTYSELPSYTPASTQYNEKRVKIALAVDAKAIVQIKFNSQLYFTRGEFEQHDESKDSHSALFSEDSTSIDDNTINGSSVIQKLGARIKWVKSYVDKKLRDFSEFKAAQISDFKAKITEHLLASASSSLVSTLNSDSLISVMIQKALQVSGARYSLGDNGFIVFGKFFGNFCIQWGFFNFENATTDAIIALSLASDKIVYADVSNTESSQASQTFYAWDSSYRTTSNIRFLRDTKTIVLDSCRYFAICRIS